MKILAVEFSSEQRGVAVLNTGERPDAPPILLGQALELGGRRALELVEQALAHARCEREQIDCLVVGLGPGSYTGIRGAIALAQGWQLGRNIKLLGISSMECMATQIAVENFSGPLNIIVDAQRGEFYLERCQAKAGQLTEIAPLHITSAAVIQNLIASGEAVFGPEASKAFPPAKNIYPEPAMLGRLAWARTDFIAGAELQPIYLRETAFKKAPPPRQFV